MVPALFVGGQVLVRGFCHTSCVLLSVDRDGRLQLAGVGGAAPQASRNQLPWKSRSGSRGSRSRKRGSPAARASLRSQASICPVSPAASPRHPTPKRALPDSTSKLRAFDRRRFQAHPSPTAPHSAGRASTQPQRPRTRCRRIARRRGCSEVCRRSRIRSESSSHGVTRPIDCASGDRPRLCEVGMPRHCP
jgi:hypothetical protein